MNTKITNKFLATVHVEAIGRMYCATNRLPILYYSSVFGGLGSTIRALGLDGNMLLVARADSQCLQENLTGNLSRIRVRLEQDLLCCMSCWMLHTVRLYIIPFDV
jgi:hypothetical protein